MCTMTAGWQKVFHENPKIGFLAAVTGRSSSLGEGERDLIRSRHQDARATLHPEQKLQQPFGMSQGQAGRRVGRRQDPTVVPEDRTVAADEHDRMEPGQRDPLAARAECAQDALAGRREARDRARDLHWLFRDLHRAGLDRGRKTRVLRREPGVDRHRPEILAAGRRGAVRR